MRLPKALLRAITFPIIPPNSDGSCGCGDRACKNAGKHPAVKWGAKSLAPGESAPVPEGFNAGLATGARSNCFVVDLDRKNGVDGLIALMALGVIGVDTLAACTPSGGYHLYFRHPGVSISNSASLLGPGIDIRGDGGYVVIPDSRHKNGGLYEWVDPERGDRRVPEVAPRSHSESEGCGPGRQARDPRARRPVVEEVEERLQAGARRGAARGLQRRELRGRRLSRHGAAGSSSRSSRRSLPNPDLGKLAELFAPSLDLMEQ